MSKPLRAIRLAAGLGTRLRPITNKTPKCLVTLGNIPLLGHWLKKLEDAGCEATLVNTHHLAEQVISYLGDWKSKTMKIHSVHEPKLLGTAGTLLKNQEFLQGATSLLVHADNAMADDLKSFLKAHKQKSKDCLLTMLTFTTQSPSRCGIVKTDAKGRVIEFHEKVKEKHGNEANGALYAFDESLLMCIKSMTDNPRDFSNDVIPKLLGKIQTWHTEESYIDIGNPDSLKQAREIWDVKAK